MAIAVKEVNDPRPLMQALDYLQRTYRVPINYEDAPLQFAGDVEDITDRVQTSRQREANPNVRIKVPRRGRLALPHLPVRAGIVADALPAVNQLVSSHESAGLPGRFKVVYEEGELSVVPVATRGAQGEWLSVQPILSTPVSFSKENRLASDVVSEVLRQVSSQRGVKVGLAWLPTGLFLTTQVTFGADKLPAATVLQQLFRELTRLSTGGQPDGPQSLLSYALLFDPGVRYYLLSIAPVPSAPAQVETFPSTSSGKLGSVPSTPKK